MIWFWDKKEMNKQEHQEMFKTYWFALLALLFGFMISTLATTLSVYYAPYAGWFYVWLPIQIFTGIMSVAYIHIVSEIKKGYVAKFGRSKK